MKEPCREFIRVGRALFLFFGWLRLCESYDFRSLCGVLIALIAAKDKFGILNRGKLILCFFRGLRLGLCCLGGHFVALRLGFTLSLSLSKCRGFSARLLDSLGLGGFSDLTGLFFLFCLLLGLYASLFSSLCGGSLLGLPAC